MPKVQDEIDSMPILQRFAVLMYDRTSNCLDGNMPIRVISQERATNGCSVPNFCCVNNSAFYVLLRASWSCLETRSCNAADFTFARGIGLNERQRRL